MHSFFFFASLVALFYLVYSLCKEDYDGKAKMLRELRQTLEVLERIDSSAHPEKTQKIKEALDNAGFNRE